ncbi:luciferin sulfotransferase [Topomyia yanbarensis]|uniref:luciferin sulfotransferase n=1 Tax=Topomyia yanbarensis TaxID=2498891 RepID=UPI00273BE630|nr:luciferin sulfotransferase [Topomyia yanbarensis]XP_058812240.1 luciferin sulfotransferase [Topomyia yanbarensis]
MKIEYRTLETELNERLDTFFCKKNSLIEVNPGGVLMPTKFQEIGEDILNLEIRKDDVWLLSYPRTGSTWAQEMVWLLGNNLDYEGAKNIQQVRTPLLELSAIFSEDQSVEDFVTKHEKVNSVTCVRNLPSPRYVKCHLPWQLLPTQMDVVRPKMIYIARNPKDLAVSYYYYCQLIHQTGGSFEDFCDIFLADQAPAGPMWAHMLGFWQRRNQSNILFLKYEDMKRNLPVVIRDCARFMNIGRELTELEVRRLCDHLQFDRMQSNPAVNMEPLMQNSAQIDTNGSVKFIRKGAIGDWKNHMSGELSKRFDAWIGKHFDGTGLEFQYE